MEKVDPGKLRDIDVYFAEPSEQLRAGFRFAMHSYGIRHEHIYATIGDLIAAVKASPPDLVIVDADLGPTASEMVRDIRHSKLGRNPFVMISMMVDAKIEGAAKLAILAGADDVLLKPVAPGTLLDRIVFLAQHRLPFIATSDYLGPERRRSGNARPSKIKHINVVNTLKDKIEGHHFRMVELDRAVKSSLDDMMAARLDSNALKLSAVCALVLKCYEEKRVDKTVEDQLGILVEVLQDAARTALTLNDPDLSQICVRLASQVHETALNYEAPTSTQLSALQKLASAFDLAKSAKQDPTPPAAH